MKLTDLSASDFKQIIHLLKKKDKLSSALQGIDQKLAKFEGPSTSPSPKARKATAPRVKRGKRGKIKELILKELKDAGKQGLHVLELSKRIKSNPNSVRVWFFTAGKKLSQIKKISPATYRLENATPPPTPKKAKAKPISKS